MSFLDDLLSAFQSEETRVDALVPPRERAQTFHVPLDGTEGVFPLKIRAHRTTRVGSVSFMSPITIPPNASVYTEIQIYDEKERPILPQPFTTGDGFDELVPVVVSSIWEQPGNGQVEIERGGSVILRYRHVSPSVVPDGEIPATVQVRHLHVEVTWIET